MAEALHTLAMIQQAESPEIGDKALGSQNMALEVRRHPGDVYVVGGPRGVLCVTNVFVCHFGG